MTVDDQSLEKYASLISKGTILFRENKPGKRMYIVQSGKIKITKKTKDEEEKVLSILTEGDFFGETSVLNNECYIGTAEVTEDSKLLIIDHTAFEELIHYDANSAFKIIKTLSVQIGEANNQIENLLLRDNTSRLINFLTKLSKKTGRLLTSGGVELSVELQEIVSKTGINESQVEEIMDKLAKIKIVKLEGDKVTIPDVSQLNRVLKYLEMKAQFGDMA